MKRKVNQVGLNTLTVSLPSSWTKKNNIKKGDELEFTEEGTRFIIAKDDVSIPLEVTADITGLDRTSILLAINGFYRLGYDTVNLTFKNPMTIYGRSDKELNVLSVIHTTINRLMGYEIVQEREKSVVIKDLQTISSANFDQVLRRIFFLLDDTAKDLLEGIKTNNISLLETIEEKHDTITKFVSFCLRILNKKGHPDQRKTPYYFHIIALLDRITDFIKYAARDLKDYGKQLNPKVVSIIELVVKDINNYHSLFYSYKNNMINEINTDRYNGEKMMKDLPKTVIAEELIISAKVFSILELILDLIESRTALEY